jgi:hypothetical protein
MTIDEPEVRAKLATALDHFTPGPVPMNDLIRAGKALAFRRRLVAAAAAASLIAAVAVIVPLALRHQSARPAPASHLHYSVTVHPARLARPIVPNWGSNTTVKANIAYGTVNKHKWWLTLVMGPGAALNVSGPDLAANFDVGSGFPEPASRTGALASLVSNGGSPWVDYGFVRADVAYLRVGLTNGQILTVRPVPVFGPRYASYVAFAVPYNSAVTRITAYSARTELGYAIPFTQDDQLQIRWLRAGQAPLPAQAWIEVASGTLARSSWSVRLDVGPWGICEVTAARWPGFPLAWCGFAALRPDQLALAVGPTPGPVPKHLPAKGSVIVTDIDLMQTAPSVSYLIMTRADHTTFRVRTVRAEGWRYCVFESAALLPTQRAEHLPGRAVVRWTAYDAAGRKLGSGSALSE